MTIEIIKDDGGNFHFSFQGKSVDFGKSRGCSRCEMTLDIVYSYLINTLIEKGLLPRNFKYYCCPCFWHLTREAHKRKSKMENPDKVYLVSITNY